MFYASSASVLLAFAVYILVFLSALVVVPKMAKKRGVSSAFWFLLQGVVGSVAFIVILYLIGLSQLVGDTWVLLAILGVVAVVALPMVALFLQAPVTENERRETGPDQPRLPR